MKIGFLGLGLMGAPIARRLVAAGHPIALWNRTSAKAEQVAAVGGTVAADARAAAADADIVFVCLTDAKAIEALLFGEGGVAPVLKAGAIVVDLSTSSPEAARAFANRLPGIAWLDCPVSGGVAGAEAGTLTLLIGGAADDLERVRPLLDAIATRITHLGPVGAGQAAKLCNQLIVSANLIAIAEAIALGRALGVDVERLPDALAGGFADSRPLQLFGPRMASHGRLGTRAATIATMAKDTRGIRAAAAASGAPALPLTDATGALYDQLIADGLGEDDLARLIAIQDKEWQA